MQKVVSISLNGIAYQLEEPGYERAAHLPGTRRARLADSPDRAEVMADLEQAIGEKCRATLSPHKTVVSTAEIERHHRGDGPGGIAPTRSRPMPRSDGASAARHGFGRRLPSAQAPVPDPRRPDLGRRLQWHRRLYQCGRHLGAHRGRPAHVVLVGRPVPGLHRAGVHRARTPTRRKIAPRPSACRSTPKS